jgi:hypothetical protein
LPDARALLRMGRAMVDLYCESFQRVPKRITLDIDAVHGGQQLRLFNAHYDEYGFQPIVVFDGEGRFVTAVLRPAKRPGGKEVRALLRRLLRAIRANWPKTEILLRADSHYCSPEVLDWYRANGLDYFLGVAPKPIANMRKPSKGGVRSKRPAAKSVFENSTPAMMVLINVIPGVNAVHAAPCDRPKITPRGSPSTSHFRECVDQHA